PLVKTVQQKQQDANKTIFDFNKRVRNSQRRVEQIFAQQKSPFEAKSHPVGAWVFCKKTDGV
ncbi:MAG: hypothetical protein LBU90_09400, partial [Bacteroidales bacterium]|nr:hypothetical protein [Bacteroidales bacterium]